MNKENYKITGYSESIANLPDYPSDEGYTAEMLKSLFDARTDKEVKEKFNEFVDAVAAELDLKLGSGAGEVKSENVADGAITKEKLAEAVLEVLSSQEEQIDGIKIELTELDRVTTELMEDIGEMDTALDSVIASQESILAMQGALIGGEA